MQMRSALMTGMLIAGFWLNLSGQELSINHPAYLKIAEGRKLQRSGQLEEAYAHFVEGLSLKEDIEWIFHVGTAVVACQTDRVDACANYLLEGVKRGMLDETMLAVAPFKKLEKTAHWTEIRQEFDTRRNAFLRQFESLSDHPLHAFIPFEHEGKWGYMHQQTREVLVDPVFLSTDFAGNALKVEVMPYNHVLIDTLGKLKHHVRKRKKTPNVPPPPPPSNDYTKHSRPPKIDKTLAEFGFRLNDKGEVSEVGAGYARGRLVGKLSYFQEDFGVLYRSPFQLEGRWYVCAEMDGKWLAVDQQGEFKDLFPTTYREMATLPYYDRNDPWFRFADDSGQRGFVNVQGKTKFVVRQGPTLTFNRTHSAKWQIYAVLEQGKMGIVDLRNMEWLIEPLDGKILDVKCTFNGKVNSPPKSRTPEVIDLYFEVQRKDGPGTFYVGRGNQVYSLK